MRPIRAGVAALAMLLFSASAAFSFDIEGALELLQDRALVLDITARVTEDGREAVWNMELTEVTISGRAVQIELDGGDLILHVQFTPYEREDTLVLVAQGQAWLGGGEPEEVTYRSAYESIPVSLGEPVLFFPLGTGHDALDNENVLNVELEIIVESYQSAVE